MLPLLMPMWDSTATMRAGVEQSYAAGVTTGGEGSALTGAAARVETRAIDRWSSYAFDLQGGYARAVAITEDKDMPTDSANGTLGTHATWGTSPRTWVSLDGSAYLASELGVRADDPLAARDPFLADRLQYALGADCGFGFTATPRDTWTFSNGYRQTGALDAADESAIGIDTHAAVGAVSYARDIGRRDTFGPELRYGYTHFYHALYDIELRRGSADVHTGTALLTETHAFGRRLRAAVSGGATVASPPPIVGSEDPVVSPEARLGLAYFDRAYRADVGYSLAYESLGPRIGFGQQHAAWLEGTLRPVAGARWRDLAVRAVVRASYGTAPIAADPPLDTDGDGEVSLPLDGTISTYTVVSGAVVEVPIVRGLVFLGGFDLAFVQAIVDPAPPALSDNASLRTIWTFGIAGVLSTDPRETLRREPTEEPDERERGAAELELERRAREAELGDAPDRGGGTPPGG